MTSPAQEQARYQVRFDWAATGAWAVGGDADVIVWTDAVAAASPQTLASLPANAAVIGADIASAGAAAKWVVQLQQRLGRRIAIAIVAAGKPRQVPDAADHTRFAVEDLLASGAVIDQLARLGLDATSPEAAAAEGAYLHLGRAVGHLMSASVTAQGAEASVAAGSFRVDDALTADDVLVLREHPGA